jgi:thiamine biosynthesis lipoprotein
MVGPVSTTGPGFRRFAMFGPMAVAVLIAHCMAPPHAGPERFEFESKHMGTTFRIVLYAADRPTAEAAAQAGFARVAELDRIMSDYDAKSELMRLCRASDEAPGRPVAVSADLFEVLKQAEMVSKQSDGAFDVTVGPLVQLWRLARRTQRLPDEKELAEAKVRVGYKKVVLNARDRTVTLKVPGMRLDLGGIAKGYAADAVLALLREKYAITRALVAASGDITCGDPPPGRNGWVVDVTPIAKNRTPRKLTLVRCAVSTSGDLEQFVEINGVRYSHILDPKTGLGLTGRRSATVIAPRGIQADSLTKVASVLPTNKALTLIESIPGAAVYLVVKETDSAPEKVVESSRFGRHLARHLQDE